ncbi:MAG: DUF4831 family protein [Bacteroidales bacterium]|nr:DUF4831 family protein [Bacteroidales bacterium]
MQRAYLLVMLSALLILAACGSKQSIIQRSGHHTGHVLELRDENIGNVIYYALPRTLIVVDVDLEKTEYTPGPYAEYASSFLGLRDVIREASHTYNIRKVTIGSLVEPDPDHLYFVDLSNAASQNFFLALTESGIICNLSNELPDADTDMSFRRSKDFGYRGEVPSFNYFMDNNLMEKIDTLFEDVREDTIALQRQTLRRSWVEKSAELRAREVADYILEIREKKFDLISGFQEISYSKEALEYMYSQMDRLESDYLDLFTGISTTKNIRYRFIHTPVKHIADSVHTLFRFSSTDGILPAKEDTGMPVSIAYNRSKLTDLLEQRINVSFIYPEPMSKGFHYRIPEYADVQVLYANEIKAHAKKLISQFGMVTYLPSEHMKLRFHQESGSIMTIGIEETTGHDE